MLRRIYGFVLIAAWLAHAMADDGFTANNYFIEPQPNGPANDFTENKAYIIGDSVQIRWETNFTKMSVTIWQNNNPEFHYIQDMSTFSLLSQIRFSREGRTNVLFFGGEKAC